MEGREQTRDFEERYQSQIRKVKTQKQRLLNCKKGKGGKATHRGGGLNISYLGLRLGNGGKKGDIRNSTKNEERGKKRKKF